MLSCNETQVYIEKKNDKYDIKYSFTSAFDRLFLKAGGTCWNLGDPQILIKENLPKMVQ